MVKKSKAKKSKAKKIANKRSATSVDEYVGERLKDFREEKGWSQGQVIDKLKEKLGDKDKISYQQLQKYENGKNRISASRLWSLANIFNVKIQEFFEGYSKKSTKTSGQLMEQSQKIKGMPDNKHTVRTLIANYKKLSEEDRAFVIKTVRHYADKEK